jgi:beta-phosphoglucomutase-like phosphatase (HAD superfamily)
VGSEMRHKHQPVADAALLQAAREAEEDAARHRPSAAQKQQQIAELEERAAEFGDPVKQSAQAKRYWSASGFGFCWCTATRTSICEQQRCAKIVAYDTTVVHSTLQCTASSTRTIPFVLVFYCCTGETSTST